MNTNAQEISVEALEQALAKHTPFPRLSAPVTAVCVRPGPDQRCFPESLELCPRRGAIGDRWLNKTWLYLADGRPDPRVQIALCNSAILELIQTLTACAHHPGDTLMTTLDLSEQNLPCGTRLQVGSAIIEVSDVENDACAKFAARHGSVVFNWIRDPANRSRRLRGLFARVVAPGFVKKGDLLVRL